MRLKYYMGYYEEEVKMIRKDLKINQFYNMKN